MLSNIHTHSTFCDGQSTPEEIVHSALRKGFVSIGFSSHGYGEDSTYGIKKPDNYICEINSLKEKYKNDIEIYLGLEEDMFGLYDRNRFDYIIGSCHFLKKDGKFYPIDSSPELFEKIFTEVYNKDPLALAESYYKSYCEYILKRKPDIIGHFDLITKYDETDNPLFLKNEKYLLLSKKYLNEALKSEGIFEVNTGAISRGYRKTPYPYENLLFELKKQNAKITVTSDSHHCDTIDCNFEETKQMLRDIGFTHTYILYQNEFKRINL